ncbi:Lsr2 family DNA-binding protein [Pseudactinotalea terrae]|uniref:Lsr2 family DNA-binding protein n=1 Tax=Pseudactinotalea terrae TaxID=1743262 RepID=UPI0012E21335|nr:Lsr2 family protein [Pseudactinotalea terrae]
MNTAQKQNHGESNATEPNRHEHSTTSAAARAWALKAGIRVAATGRMSQKVINAWRAAGSPMPELPVVPIYPPGRTRAEVAAAAREWARGAGLEVADVGRLPHRILAAWAADGSPFPDAALCSQPDCSRVADHRAVQLCRPCYARLRRAQKLHSAQDRSGAAHIAWIGSEVGYGGAHQRIVSRFGAASLYVCNACDARARDWALMPDAAEVRQDPGRPVHSPDPEDYRPMCHPCHQLMDWQHRQAAAALEDAEAVLDGLDVAALVAFTPPPRLPLRPWPESAEQ